MTQNEFVKRAHRIIGSTVVKEEAGLSYHEYRGRASTNSQSITKSYLLHLQYLALKKANLVLSIVTPYTIPDRLLVNDMIKICGGCDEVSELLYKAKATVYRWTNPSGAGIPLRTYKILHKLTVKRVELLKYDDGVIVDGMKEVKKISYSDLYHKVVTRYESDQYLKSLLDLSQTKLTILKMGAKAIPHTRTFNNSDIMVMVSDLNFWYDHWCDMRLTDIAPVDRLFYLKMVGMTRKDIAAVTGISYTTLSYWVTGGREISGKTANKIHHLFNKGRESFREVLK